MNKRKILLLVSVLMMAAVLAVGGTLAYFTDTDDERNVFTVGNIDIDLKENYIPDSELLPGTKTQNAVNKDVWVENTGDNEVWLRVIVSVPAKLDVLTVYPENYEEVAAKNILHWNTVAGVEEIWNVKKANEEAVLSADKMYNEYTFYYNTKLGPGEKTAQLLEQVYLDSRVDCKVENGVTSYYIMENGENKGYVDLSNLTILVRAEAIQATGFDNWADAFAAFDAQYGK